MKEDEIKRLVKIVEESNIGELEISRWGRTIKITKYLTNSGTGNSSTIPIHAMPSPQQSSANMPPQQQEQKKEEKPGASPANATEIKSPMVGTFYRAPAPDADPYIEVNNVVKKGQVLCIIEAMKLMNEIESEVDGRLIDILVEDGQPVEYNQPLFLIEAS